MADNRDNLENKTGSRQNQNPGQPVAGERGQEEETNPQDGSQWDNYQTRSLSSEGEDKMKESDLLRADEVPGQEGKKADDSNR